MKINSLLIIVVAVLGGLLVGGAVLYLHLSYSRQINALNEYIAGQGSRIVELQDVVSGLRLEIADFNSVKSNLTRKLDDETLTKAAIAANLNALEEQFREATRESMRVEGNLADRLNKIFAEAESLKVSLNNEVVSNKLINDQLQETKIKLNRETERTLATLDLYWSVSKDLQWEAKAGRILEEEKTVAERQLDIAKKLIGGVLNQASGQPIKAGKTVVKSIIVIPADVDVSVGDIDKLKPAVEKTCAINQIWFFAQINETFSCEKPLVIRGQKSLAEYDVLSSEERIDQVRKETNTVWNNSEIFVIFLYGSKDKNNWGRPMGVLMNETAIGLIVDEDVRGWGILAHELGHAMGLPHLATDNKLAMMRVNSRGWAEAADFFPFVIFTDEEKIKVRSNLKK